MLMHMPLFVDLGLVPWQYTLVALSPGTIAGQHASYMHATASS